VLYITEELIFLLSHAVIRSCVTYWVVRFEAFTAVTMKNIVSGMWRCVDLALTDFPPKRRLIDNWSVWFSGTVIVGCGGDL
jgi:hypothetical protein